MRTWHDGYGDCDTDPGSPECLCCYKLWDTETCQFIPVEIEDTKKETLKTLKEDECLKCPNNRKPSFKCGYWFWRSSCW